MNGLLPAMLNAAFGPDKIKMPHMVTIPVTDAMGAPINRRKSIMIMEITPMVAGSNPILSI